MRTTILLFTALIGLSITSFAQPMIKCDGFRKLFFKPGVLISGIPMHTTISKSELWENGLVVTPPDDSYKVIGFVVVGDCPSGISTDFSIKTYTGNKIEPHDPFLKMLPPPDKFGIEICCVNVEREGVRYLLTDRRFMLIQ